MNYLVNQLKSLATIVPDSPEFFSTYNPPRDGCAYYITKEGHKLRQVHKFSIDVENDTKKNNTTTPYDDTPADPCTKIHHVMFFCGFVLNTITAMDITSFLNQRGEKIHLLPCIVTLR